MYKVKCIFNYHKTEKSNATSLNSNRDICLICTQLKSGSYYPNICLNEDTIVKSLNVYTVN